MKIIFIIAILAFSVFAQTKPEGAKQPKILTADQITRLRQAQEVREKAQLRLALAKAEAAQVEAEILALVRLCALELKINPEDYELDLSEVAQGIIGFKAKPKPPDLQKKE